MILLVLVNFFYGLVYPIGKIALRHTTPLFLTGFRMLASSLVVLGCYLLFKHRAATFNRKAIIPLILGGLFAVYIANWLEFFGLDSLSPAKTAFLYNLYPFAAALVSYIYLGHKLTHGKWLGLTIGFLGSLPLLYQDAGSLFFGLPDLAVISAVFAVSFGWIFIQQATCQYGCDSILANGITMLVGGVAALVHSYGTELWNPVPVTNTHQFIIWSIALMITSNILANSLYIMLLKRYSLTFLSFTSFLTPLLTALLDYFMLGLSVSYTFYISSAIMGLGFYLFYKDELST